MIKIGHCGGFEFTRAELAKLLKSNKKATSGLNKCKGNRFIALQGNTQVMGYAWVLQCLVKKYKNLEVVMVGNNMSIYSI